MRYRLSLMVLTGICLGLAACQATPSNVGPVVPDIGDPDAAVADIRDAYVATPPESRYASYRTEKGKTLRSRVMLRRQSENLLFSHPDHVDGRMTAALLAYEADDPVEAARHLDYLLRIDPTASDAALLRARIALEEGNATLAKRLLDTQVKLRPSHAGLREAHASALYLTGNLDRAAEALDEAERLGAAPGRIAYNRGLVAEETGDIVMAARHYQLALDRVPHWRLPQERLAGLRAALPAEALAPAVVDVPSGVPVPEPVELPVPAPAPKPVQETQPEAPPAKDRAETVVSFPPPAPREPVRKTKTQG